MEDERPLLIKKEEDEPQQRVEELKCFNAALQAENDMLERFIRRLDPQELMCQAGEEGPGAAGVSLEHGGHGAQVQLLTLKQKLNVAKRDIAETSQEQEKPRERYEIIRDSFKASMKEAELRLSEIRQSKNDFERRLLKPLKDNTLQMKRPEKILQFIQDKSKISQMEKFNMKNQMLKVQEKKLKQQLQQKREMGKADYEEIFYDYDEQNVDTNLDELQVNSLKVKHILSSHKEKLRSVTQESLELSNEIRSRELMLPKIEKEIQLVEEECLKAEALKKHLRHQMTNYQAPEITEYINIRDKHKELRQSVHIWERKVAIAKMALRGDKHAWKTQIHTLTPANSASAGARSAELQTPVRLPHILQ